MGPSQHIPPSFKNNNNLVYACQRVKIMKLSSKVPWYWLIVTQRTAMNLYLSFYILNGFLFIADSAISVILLLLDLSTVCDGWSQMVLIQLNSSCVI